MFSHEYFQRFVNGQLEIMNRQEGHCFRGEIESIHVSDTLLEVRLRWAAAMSSHGWVNSARLEWRTFRDFGGFALDSAARPTLNANGNVYTFYLPGYRVLDPKRVKGLRLNAKVTAKT